MSKRTAIFHMNGQRYVFRDEQVDALLERVSADTDTIEEAWELTRAIGEQQ